MAHFHGSIDNLEAGMDFLKLAKERFSLRKYSPRPVEASKVEAVLEAAALAPTGCNNQPQRILLVDDPAVLEKIRRCTSYQFGAPLTFVVCYDTTACWVNHEGHPIGETDAAIVTTHMMLEAVEQGLGTCWVGSFNHAKLQAELNIPKNYCPVALLPMGYPADDAHPASMHTAHRPAKTFVWRNSFKD